MEPSVLRSTLRTHATGAEWRGVRAPRLPPALPRPCLPQYQPPCARSQSSTLPERTCAVGPLALPPTPSHPTLHLQRAARDAPQPGPVAGASVRHPWAHGGRGVAALPGQLRLVGRGASAGGHAGCGWPARRRQPFCTPAHRARPPSCPAHQTAARSPPRAPRPPSPPRPAPLPFKPAPFLPLPGPRTPRPPSTPCHTCLEPYPACLEPRPNLQYVVDLRAYAAAAHQGGRSDTSGYRGVSRDGATAGWRFVTQRRRQTVHLYRGPSVEAARTPLCLALTLTCCHLIPAGWLPSFCLLLSE